MGAVKILTAEHREKLIALAKLGLRPIRRVVFDCTTTVDAIPSATIDAYEILFRDFVGAEQLAVPAGKIPPGRLAEMLLAELREIFGDEEG